MDEEKKPLNQEGDVIQNPSSEGAGKPSPSILFSGLRSSLSAGFEKGKGATLRGKDFYQKLEIKNTAEITSAMAKQFLDKGGITEKASLAYKTTQEHLDKVSGAKLLKLVEERMTLQDQYNDILATKLHEALSRIEALEQQLSKSDQK